MPSCREGPDEDAIVERVTGHADPVAENGPAGKWARRVDGNDPHALPTLTIGFDKPITECRFAGSRIAGDAEDPGAARVGPKALEYIGISWTAVVYDPQGARDGARLPRQNPVD
jgi:hypothetical protein